MGFKSILFSVGWPRLQSRVLHQSRDFPEVTSVWGVSAVVILDSSVNCVCVWSTKKLTMPAYCVAAKCNNSQMTPNITMHELPRNQPAVRRKWIKFICNGVEWSKDRTQAAESVKWRPQQAYGSNQVLFAQPQTIFSTLTLKILTRTHR